MFFCFNPSIAPSPVLSLPSVPKGTDTFGGASGSLLLLSLSLARAVTGTEFYVFNDNYSCAVKAKTLYLSGVYNISILVPSYRD